MPPLKQPPRQQTSRIVTCDHDPAMSHPKPLEEDLLHNTPPIATTSTSTSNTVLPSSIVSEQHVGESMDSNTNSARPDFGNLIDLDDTTPNEQPHAKPVAERQNGAKIDPQNEADIATDPMESSVATLKPTKPQYLTINTTPYIDPTPPTPTASQPPSRTSSAHRSKGQSSGSSPARSDTDIGDDEARFASEDEREGSSRSEIQSIMEQFPVDGGGPGEEEVMSPRLEIASPLLASPPIQHPPRKSSLEPLAPSIAQQIHEMQGLRISDTSSTSARSKGKLLEDNDHRPPVPPKDVHSDEKPNTAGSPVSSTTTLHRPPPPEPEPEPALPFDFHRFLEQLKHKKADPVARYLKSFLNEFGKRQWMVHEQVKIISDFLAFIGNKMAQCEVWRDVSDAEFDNAREGMEKLVMNRLYSQTFSPAIPAPQPIPGAKPKKRGGERPLGPGRKGQHQEDVERDDILAQKISIYGWVREEHLDIPPVTDSGKRFLSLAQQGQSRRHVAGKTMLTRPELLKIRSYRAPRDKIICVLNCCKVIFGIYP